MPKKSSFNSNIFPHGILKHFEYWLQGKKQLKCKNEDNTGNDKATSDSTVAADCKHDEPFLKGVYICLTTIKYITM